MVNVVNIILSKEHFPSNLNAIMASIIHSYSIESLTSQLEEKEKQKEFKEETKEPSDFYLCTLF